MAKCIILGCSFTLEDKGTLFSFPKDEFVRNKWAQFVRLYNSSRVFQTTDRICSQHFLQYDFTNWFQFHMGFVQKLLLVKGAIPTVNKFCICFFRFAQELAFVNKWRVWRNINWMRKHSATFTQSVCWNANRNLHRLIATAGSWRV